MSEQTGTDVVVSKAREVQAADMVCTLVCEGCGAKNKVKQEDKAEAMCRRCKSKLWQQSQN